MLVLVAIMMVVVLGMLVFAVDAAWVIKCKTQLQSAADAAALAGASTLQEDYTLAAVQAEAENYAAANESAAHCTVSFGTWDPDAKQFAENLLEPHAVRVVLDRSTAKDNAVASFFGRVFGREYYNLQAESIAVGAVPIIAPTALTTSVYVTSTKDLSNVVLHFEDGTHQKFDGLTGYTGTFSGTGENAGKVIIGVWIKSGTYLSGDGPGYGEYLADPGEGTTVYGINRNEGSLAKVSATFNATGTTFTQSGSAGPVRLVR
jgi:hypothetical protein